MTKRSRTTWRRLGDFFLVQYRQTFERAHEELVTLRRREQRGAALYAVIDAAVTGGAYAAIVLAASRRQLTVGDVALYTAAVFQLSGALSHLAGYHGVLRTHRLRLQAFFGLLDRPPSLGRCPPPCETDRPEVPRRHGDTEGTRRIHRDAQDEQDIGRACLRVDPEPRAASECPEIEFRDVWFTYPGSAAPALRGINLRIAAGEKIALVGENGAGKTTLLSLIARLYDPTDGEICVDGTPLRTLDLPQ